MVDSVVRKDVPAVASHRLGRPELRLPVNGLSIYLFHTHRAHQRIHGLGLILVLTFADRGVSCG
jgi:hypothetical protein